MSVPATTTEFIDLVLRSGLLEEPVLDGYRPGAPPGPQTPRQLAAALVRDGRLTAFQAELLLQGKGRFLISGKYKLLDRLGSGGMGHVFLCEHISMRRRVALKVLPAALAENPASLERFHREARAAAALDHPNIVRAYDLDREARMHFLVMEYVAGTD